VCAPFCRGIAPVSPSGPSAGLKGRSIRLIPRSRPAGRTTTACAGNCQSKRTRHKESRRAPTLFGQVLGPPARLNEGQASFPTCQAETWKTMGPHRQPGSQRRVVVVSIASPNPARESRSRVRVSSPATVAARVDAGSVRRDPVTKAQISLLGLEGTMHSVQDRLTLLLRAYRTIRFCDTCLALKMGAFPREVREAVVLIGDGVQISSEKCSECLQEKTVVHALAA